MIRWGVILVGAALLPCAAGAQSNTVQTNTLKTEQAFAAVCSAAIDEKPDLVSIATSAGMSIAGGLKDGVTIGHTSLRIFVSPETKQNIIIATNTYSDAREMNCRSTVPASTARAELENLAHSLKLEGEFIDMAAVTQGRWKRPGNQPEVFVTMTSTAATTVLNMQRVDIVAAGPEKK
jgi:hypothetical protein